MKKILVVENSPTIISVADSLLRQRGFDVTCLSDGSQAYDYICAEKPDLIFTALGIEGLNGIQLCRKIVDNPQTGGIPVVLFVGERDSVFLDKLDVCGARGRMKKPFSPKELLAVADKFLGAAEPVAARVVDQSAAGAPKLKPKASPQEIGTRAGIKAASSEEGMLKKHETVFNLDWEDLKEKGGLEAPPDRLTDLDDSGLVLEDDQYGLTNLADEVLPVSKANPDQDYDWFINEMQKEITDKPEEKPASSQGAAPKKPAASYQDLGAASSPDDTKYRRYLDQFKKDTKTAPRDSQPRPAGLDIDWIVEAISDRLAKKIVAGLDKNELRAIINSILKSSET